MAELRREVALVDSVQRVVAGSATQSALHVGDTMVLVYDCSDFPDVGEVSIAGTELAYKAVLDSHEYDSGVTADTLVLAAASTVAAAVNVRVDVWPKDITYQAQGALLGSSTPIAARLQHHLIERAQLQVQASGLATTVMVEQDHQGTWWVTDIIGQDPSLNLAYAADGSLLSSAVNATDWAMTATIGNLIAMEPSAPTVAALVGLGVAFTSGGVGTIDDDWLYDEQTGDIHIFGGGQP